MTTLLDFLRTSESTTGVWDYVSASRLNLWSKCPLAFRRRYVDGIESAPSVSMFVGKVVHGVLEHVYRCRSVGTICTETDLPAFGEAAWTSAMSEEPCFFDDESHEQKCRTQVYDLAAAYLREIDIESEKPLAVEKRYEAQLIDPLSGEDLGVPLVGIVDLLLEEQPNEAAELRGRRQPGSNVLTLVDFKTAASASSSCAVQHELQLSAYAYLIRQLLDREESALEIRQLVKTKVPKIVVHRFPPRTDEHFRHFFDLVREYLDNLDRGVFNYRPGFGCQMCDQAGNCSVS